MKNSAAQFIDLPVLLKKLSKHFKNDAKLHKKNGLLYLFKIHFTMVRNSELGEMSSLRLSILLKNDRKVVLNLMCSEVTFRQLDDTLNNANVIFRGLMDKMVFYFKRVSGIMLAIMIIKNTLFTSNRNFYLQKRDLIFFESSRRRCFTVDY